MNEIIKEDSVVQLHLLYISLHQKWMQTLNLHLCPWASLADL